MPTARPTGDELLQAVQEFLQHLAQSELNGQAAFHARVAANAIVIAQRERADGEDMRDQERMILAKILDQPDGSLENLSADLARRIAEADPGVDKPQILDYLRQVSRNKLRLSNPKYLMQGDH